MIGVEDQFFTRRGPSLTRLLDVDIGEESSVRLPVAEPGGMLTGVLMRCLVGSGWRQVLDGEASVLMAVGSRGSLVHDQHFKDQTSSFYDHGLRK